MVSLQTLTHWTALGSFVFYVLALSLWTRATKARLLWTVACLLMLIHIVLAFQAFHHWSHSAAYEATARQTAELTGMRWGGGIYANYALLVIWLVDVIWWWRGYALYRTRPKTVSWCIQGFLAFMWFNATIVFGHQWGRVIGIAGFLIVAVVWWNSRRAQNKTASTGHSRSGF